MKIQNFEIWDTSSLAELRPEGWYDLTPIFEFYCQTNFCFPIKICADNRIIGIGAAIIHGNAAWFGHIIVHRDFRKQGLGRFITQGLMEIAHAKDCTTIFLIATDLGAPVYEKLGFEIETEYLFYKDIKPFANWKASENLIPYSGSFEKQVANFDKLISCEDRTSHLVAHLNFGFLFVENDQLEGYYLPTFGEGIILASSDKAGIELMNLRFSTKDNASFPMANFGAIDLLKKNNYQEFKTAKRMIYGNKRDWKAESIYNRIGGNLG